MIIGNFNETREIETLHPLLPMIFDWIRTNINTINEVGVNRIDIIPGKAYVNIEEVHLKEPTEQLVERHEKYLDIHIPISGQEVIGWKAVGTLTSPLQSYDENKDVALYCTTPSIFVTLSPGNFCIMTPTDGHAPIIGKGILKKLCVKVLL